MTNSWAISDQAKQDYQPGTEQWTQALVRPRSITIVCVKLHYIAISRDTIQPCHLSCEEVTAGTTREILALFSADLLPFTIAKIARSAINFGKNVLWWWSTVRQWTRRAAFDQKLSLTHPLGSLVRLCKKIAIKWENDNSNYKKGHSYRVTTTTTDGLTDWLAEWDCGTASSGNQRQQR